MIELNKQYELGFEAGLAYAKLKHQEEIQSLKSLGKKVTLYGVFSDRDSQIVIDSYYLSPGTIYYTKVQNGKIKEIGVSLS